MKICPPFGIDLGTTRTAAAVFLPQAEVPVVACDEEDRPTLPSLVRPGGEGRWLVGYDAQAAPGDAAPVIESVKRRMGATRQEVDSSNDTLPEHISAIILAKITDRIQKFLDRQEGIPHLTPTEAVITVPAYFDAPQIEATRRAGEFAGLNVNALVQEPTAAAIYHTWKKDLGDGTYLVYDLGGGTFDVSIIRSIYGEFQVLSIDGDNHLGGDDFDRRLAEYIRYQLVDEGYDLGEDVESDADRIAFEGLTRIGREIKEKLSDVESLVIRQKTQLKDRSGRPIELNLAIERHEFEEVIEDLVEATILASRRAVLDAEDRHDFARDEIDGIFLVGGSTRVPVVTRRLGETIASELGLDDDAISGDEPETSVALGAALYAAAIAPLRFESSSSEVVIKIDDIPTDEDPFLSGSVEFPEGQEPTEALFSRGDIVPTPNDQTGPPAAALAAPPGATSCRHVIGLKTGSNGADFRDDDFPVALLDSDDQRISVVFRRGGKDLFGPFDLWLPRRPEGARPAPSLALSNPAVLAKDINIEVVEDGKSHRHTLLEHGAHLPATARQRLVTADRSGSLVLRLYQNLLPIHTIVLPLPEDTEPGMSVQLTIKIDHAMNLTASGSVGKQTFWARIDRPSMPKERQWEEIEELMARAEATTEELWGAEARRFEAQSRNILAGIRAAVRHDPHRLQVLARRLEVLLEEFAPRPTRTPGLPRIELLLDTIRRIVFAAEDERLGKSHSQWQAHLAEMADLVQETWLGDDDERWRSVADRVQATYESVAQDEYHYRRRDPQVYARTLQESSHQRLVELRNQAEDFPFAADEDNRDLQRLELRRIQESIADLEKLLPSHDVGSSDVAALKRLTQALTHLEGRLDRVHILGVPRKGDSS